MLYFSETAWTLPDFMEVNDAFGREYDQEEYEQKIGLLSRNFLADASKNNPDDFNAWKAAVRKLRQEDHYLLVLITSGNGSSSASKGGFPSPLVIGAVTGGSAVVILYFLLTR